MIECECGRKVDDVDKADIGGWQLSYGYGGKEIWSCNDCCVEAMIDVCEGSD